MAWQWQAYSRKQPLRYMLHSGQARPCASGTAASAVEMTMMYYARARRIREALIDFYRQPSSSAFLCSNFFVQFCVLS